jgi:hypothetical protein
MLPGRAADARPADTAELAATSVLELPIDAASVKRRDGGPKDHPDDLALPVWAGVLPLAHEYGAPQPAPELGAAVRFPSYLEGRKPPWAPR